MATAESAQRLIDDAGHRAAAPARGAYVRLLGFVRRRLRADDAEDIVQDAYVRLAVAGGRAEIRDPDAFLRTAALNLVRDRARAAAVRRTVAGDGEGVACGSATPEQTLTARQQLLVLESALAELPLKRRAALALYRFDDLSHAAIAERLGLSVSMVEKHIRRALDHCRRRLAEANGDG